MKIAKIINIMKFFTSCAVSGKIDHNPPLRVILPTLWGASPHGLGEKGVGAAGSCQSQWCLLAHPNPAACLSHTELGSIIFRPHAGAHLSGRPQGRTLRSPGQKWSIEPESISDAGPAEYQAKPEQG